ncbi:MAG: metallophosphoesterase family protein [Gemmatimonadota bacterium]
MPVAALYDIHGNLPALEAVLREVHAAGIEGIVVGGDVAPGPMPRECLARLSALDVPVRYIRGNCENDLLARMRGGTLDHVPEQAREIMRWSADELRAAATALEGWPATVELSIPGAGRVLFCHGTPDSATEIFTRSTPDARLARIFEGVTADVVVCGHTHMQFDRMAGVVRVVNAGSVGMPFGEAGAYWLLLGSGIEFRRTEYDTAAAATRIRKTRYPEAEAFAAHNVVQPPTEAAMLAAFSKFDAPGEDST